MNRTLLRAVVSCLLFAGTYSNIYSQALAKRLPAGMYEKSLPDYLPLALEFPSLPDIESSGRFTLAIEGWKTFSFYLEAVDLRAPGYRLRTASGKQAAGLGEVHTFQGYLESQPDARAYFTLDKNYIYGFFEYEGETWYIQPMNRFLAAVPQTHHLLSAGSKTADLPGVCGHIQDQDPGEEIPTASLGSESLACSTVEMALAADYSMYAQYEDLYEVERQLFSVLNMVQSNYTDDFNRTLTFQVSEIFVADEAEADPWTDDSDAQTVLDDFTKWGNSGGFTASYDIASLWTDRLFTDSIVGLAWIREICSAYRYNVLSDFFTDAQKLRVLQAHEIGHNFGASHDRAESPTIMAPRVNTSNEWSELSVLAVNYNMITSTRCLSACFEQIAPTAVFSHTLVDTCELYTVRFADQTPPDPGSRKWIFEGGNPAVSFLAEPEVTYETPGVYDVWLIVQNLYGEDSLLMEDLIHVSEKLATGIAMEVDTAALEVRFEASANLDVAFLWEFGDGDSSELANPVHVYDTSGWYEVRLSAKNSCGTLTDTTLLMLIAAPQAEFSSSITEACLPATVSFVNESQAFGASYRWEFPGAQVDTSVEENPVVTYPESGIFPVRLEVVNDAGVSVLMRDSFIRISAMPDSGFTYNLALPEVRFSSTPAPGDQLRWDFGDGTVDTLDAAPVHRYTAPGSYPITLTLSNICGTVQSTDTLFLAGVAPSVAMEISRDTLCNEGTVEFRDASAGEPTSWSWLFPGGSPDTSYSQNPVVTYTKPGTYDVALGVRNPWGVDNVIEKNRIHVLTEPTAAIKMNQSGQNIAFISNSSGGGLSYFWDFGDGKTSSLETPFHTYAAAGDYKVQLVTSNYCGSDTATLELSLQFTSLWELAENWSADIFPNPNQGNFSLKLNLPGVRGAVWVDLYDMGGKHLSRKVLTLGARAEQFDLNYEGLAPGSYLLTCTHAGQSLVRKLLIH